MFRSILSMSACALALAACQSAGGGVDVSQVQKIASDVCRFEPTAQTVLNIFNSGSPLLDTASEIASAVCSAINTPRSAGQPPTVNGVTVQGRRV